MSRGEDMETLSKKFLKTADKMIRNNSDITTYIVGYEIDLPPKETDKLVSHLKAKDLISAPDPARQESQGSDFAITSKGREYI